MKEYINLLFLDKSHNIWTWQMIAKEETLNIFIKAQQETLICSAVHIIQNQFMLLVLLDPVPSTIHTCMHTFTQIYL